MALPLVFWLLFSSSYWTRLLPQDRRTRIASLRGREGQGKPVEVPKTPTNRCVWCTHRHRYQPPCTSYSNRLLVCLPSTTLMPSPLADAVIRAAAWDDGGAEFIFADGTIMSFVDNMNTFVALRGNPSTRDAQQAATQASRKSLKEEKQRVLSRTSAALAGEYVDSISNTEDDDDDSRELCFTAWTLSKDVGKVRAALHIFNSLSEKPRLLAPLLPSESPASLVSSSLLTASTSAMARASLVERCCGVWQEPGPPIDTLLLERHTDLFQRHVVFGTVLQCMPVVDAPLQKQEVDPTSADVCLPLSQSSVLDVMATPPTTVDTAAAMGVTTHPREHAGHSDVSNVAPSKEVPVGTVLELWCALRRVCMTVAVHRETFTVRWPAPVTRSDGSRLPPSFHARDTAALHRSPASPGWSSNISPSSSASVPLLFTYMEQTFPVRDPPDTWRTMLELALELDAELSEAERESSTAPFVSVSPSHVTACATSTKHGNSASVSSTWHGVLPAPHRWSGALNQNRNTNPCRFSPLTAPQATHLAAPRTVRAMDAMRALHAPGTRLCWLYEANRCSTVRDTPSGVYWCLRGSAVNKSVIENVGDTVVETSTPVAAPFRATEVVAWVAEDGSVVRTTLEGKGYTIRHHRLHLSSPYARPSAPAVYRLQAHDTAAAMTTVDKRLPSKVTPLRCQIYMPLQPASTQVQKSGEELPSCRAFSPSATLHLRGDPNSGYSPNDNKAKKNAATVDAAAATVSQGALAVVIIDPQSLHCLPASRTADVERCRTAAIVTPACVCSALASLTATLVSSEPPITENIDVHFNAAARALSLASLDSGVNYRRTTLLEAGRAVRHLSFGRYIASVVDVAIQLSQVNCAAHRASDAARPSVEQSGPGAFPYVRPFAGTTNRLSAAAATSRQASAASVVYLTSRLDGIGTFTALTNGTIRVHFDDRTLLTLIPGVNEVDEEQLLATCVLRNATRCTMRAAQCHPGHAMHRYLAYALPFRRYVYWRAVHPLEPAVMDNEYLGALTSDMHATVPQEQPQQRQVESARATVVDRVDHTIAYGNASASLASISAMEAEASLMEPALLDQSECLLPSFLSGSLATSFGSAVDDDERLATVLRNTVGVSEVNSEAQYHPLPNGPTCPPRACLSASHAVLSCDASIDSGPALGLVDTQRTVQSHYDAEIAEAAAHGARLQDLLDHNAALSKATRSLLRD